MADENLVDQDEIERLLSQAKQDAPAAAEEKPAAAEAPAAGGKKPAAAEAPAAGGKKPAAAEAPAGTVGEDEIESLIAEGEAPAEQTATATEDDDDDDKLLGQDDIEKLLEQSTSPSAKPTPQPPAQKEAASAPFAGEGTVPQSDVEYLLNQAERALQSIDATADEDLPHGVAAFRLEEFTGAPASAENATLDLIRDVELDLKIELGRTHMYLEDVLKLRKGSVVPLDKLAGDPVDIYVNGRLVARGEVLVLNDNFCVRVAELIAGTSACA